MDHIGVVMVHYEEVELVIGEQACAGGVGIICFCRLVELDTDCVVWVFGIVEGNTRRIDGRMC